jgi:class 3 adenylate cyclase/tetratricopeptide (TPR) repeat protein
MTSSQGLLRSYVSPFLASRLLSGGEPPRTPGVRQGRAAVLFADIAGFTPLAERLGRRPGGTEELSQLLDGFFGPLVELVCDHGGDVITFAGDALVAAWEADTTAAESATSWAARCALAMQRLARAAVDSGPRLSLRIGIGLGDVTALRTRGADEMWHLILAGDALAQAGLAARQAAPGQVVLSPEAHRVAGTEVRERQGPDGQWRVANVRATSVAPPARSSVTGVGDPSLRACVPPPIHAHLATGRDDWVSELRPITAMFVTISDGPTSTAGRLEVAQSLVADVHDACAGYEGAVQHVLEDDKGIVLVAAFGVPPLAHGDDPVRAVRAALDAHTALLGRGLHPAVGLATGEAFCGIVGNDLHREYVLVGDTVNLAARLMQAAPGTVLCDGQTHRAARGRWPFRQEPALELKGKSVPVPVYRPLRADRPMRPPDPSVASFVGREHEWNKMQDHLRRLANGIGGVVAVVGERGIGTSRLVAEFARQGSSQGCLTLLGAADSIDRTTPYHALRPILTESLGLDGLPKDRQRAALTRWLQRRPELQGRAPLLNRVLPFDLPESPTTQQLTGPARAESTADTVVDLLRLVGGEHAVTSAERIVLLLDDVQWLDSASWSVVRRALAVLHPLLVVLGCRPEAERNAEFRRLSEDQDVDLWRLQPLGDEDAAAFVRQLLPHDSAHGMRLILERAQGVPFFLEELAYAFRDGSRMAVGDVSDEVGFGAHGAPDVTGIPAGVQGIVGERLDRLAPPLQMTLKVASVIGRRFDRGTLEAVHPLTPDPSAVQGWLDDLTTQGFLVQEGPESTAVHRFRHALTHEVTYHRLLSSQRQPLHRAVGRWYEDGSSRKLPASYSMLAHHWERAGEPARAMEYLELAGEQSLREGACSEATDALETALRIGVRLDPAPAARRAARWHRELADAYMGLGRLTESRGHAMEALALLDQPLAVQRPRIAGDLVGQALRQAWHRVHVPGRCAPQTIEAVMEAIRAHERLALLHYYGNARTSSLASVLHGVNLAQTVPTSPELARGYAAMSLGAGMMRLHPLARSYAAAALQAARHADDLPALAFVLLGSAAYGMSVGAWPAARASLAEGLEIAEQLPDHRRRAELAALWFQVLYHQGDLTPLTEWTQDMWTRAVTSGDPQRKAHALLAEICLLLPRGEAEVAAVRTSEALALLEGQAAYADEIFARGVQSLAELRCGRPTAAREAAARALQLILLSRPVAVHAVEGYAATAEVFLELRAAGNDALARPGRLACLALRRFAGAFPLARPRALLVTGMSHYLENRDRAGWQALHRSLMAATRLAMPYESARAHLEIARRSPPGAPARQRHLDEAARSFDRLGAVHELNRTLDTARGH